MRTIVVDDEPWMLKRFEIECESLPDIQLLASFRNPLKALDFSKDNDVELAFLDVEMPGLNGIELAQKLREINPGIIIIFISAYDNYMTEAFRTKIADYYIIKPYSSGDIEAVVERARLLSGRLSKKIFAKTFGSFELMSNNKYVVFQDNKAKEFLAMLVDNRGNALPEKKAISLLWPQLSFSDGEIKFHRSYKNLIETLSIIHLSELLDKTISGFSIHTSVIDCDLYKLFDGDVKTAKQFTGEYMLGYDWAQTRLPIIKKQSAKLCSYQDTQISNYLLANIRTLDDARYTICYMNDAFLSLVGYTRDEIKEKFNDSYRAMILRDDFNIVDNNVREQFKQGKPAEAQYRLCGKGDREVWVICKSEIPKIVNDKTHEISSVLIDISETKAEQSNLEKAAHYDSLTGLYNRGYTQEKIEQYLSSTTFTSLAALVIMDVDNFKAVNDTYGHPFADTVLSDIAAIFIRELRSSDIVCRLGGDEMMLFLKGIDSISSAKRKIESITTLLRQRLARKTEKGEISCSFGVAMCPQYGKDYNTLYKHADEALYKAKKTKDSIEWYSE